MPQRPLHILGLTAERHAEVKAAVIGAYPRLRRDALARFEAEGDDFVYNRVVNHFGFDPLKEA